MKRKVCAALLALGMILCQIPQTAIAAENAVAEEAAIVAEAEEAPVETEAEEEAPVETETEEAATETEAEEEPADVQAQDTQKTAADSDKTTAGQGGSQTGEKSATSDKQATSDPDTNAKGINADSSEKAAASKNGGENKGLTDAPEAEQAEKPLTSDQAGKVSDKPADTAQGLVGSADGQYAINIYYDTSCGTVVAMVDDVAATKADGGDLVYLTITPDSGYEYQSADIVVKNSDGESVRTVPQEDGTISFLMPDSSVTVTALFTAAESDTPVTPIILKEMSLVVDQPSVGETTDTEAPSVTASDWTYEVTDAFWADSSGSALSTPLTFESDTTYYIAATVKTYWESDANYFFPQADLTVNIENGSVVGMPAIINVSDAGSTMQILIAVQPAVRRFGDQIQVWAGSIDGNTTMADSGGSVAVNYTPSEPNIYDFGKYGTFSAGDIVQFYIGDEITVIAQANAGCHFVGWYRVNIDYNMSGGDTDHNGATPNKAYSGSALSTDTSFTYKPGETILSGDSEPLRYVCAVFEEDTAETVTVSFDPGTGMGSMDSVTVDAGAEYELPPCTFTHANTKRTFYAWSVDDELKKPGGTITVSKDTVVIAKWLDTSRAQRIDNSVDKSTTEVVCTLRLKDTRTGEVTEESVYKKTTASGFSEPSNSTVKAMIREAGESAAARAREIAGHDVTIVSEGVSDLEILETINNRTYTDITGTDDAGDYAGYIIIDGEWWQLWRYIVTVEAEYTSSVLVTLHWSSVDGVDLMEPVVVEAEPGTRLDDALIAAGKPYVDLFTMEGYEDYSYRTLHPVSDFADEDAFYDDCIDCSYIIEGNTDIYAVMFKKLDAVEISIDVPACGSTDAPAVSVSAGEYGINQAPRWVKDADSLEPYEGELVGGNKYMAEVWLFTDFRYFLPDDVQITVNGGELESSELTFDNRVGIIAGVAVDHDWGAWKTTKEPTETEDGEETRTCARCGETETRKIAHLLVEYRNTEGDGSSWEKGSTDSLTFVFERNINDETAFSHFTGIQVDGKAVEASNYTAISGSVKINLMPAFLETLSIGKHTLTALFDDANAVTVSFSVTEKAAPAGDNTDKKDSSENNTQKTVTGKAVITAKAAATVKTASTGKTSSTGKTTSTGKAAKTTVPATAARTPNTGDNSNAGVYLLMFTAAFMSLLFSLIQRKKHRRS